MHYLSEAENKSIELISYNTIMPVKYNHIFLDVIV